MNLASGPVLRGEIANFNKDTNILGIIHVGANDGKFHLPTTLGIYDSDAQTGGIVSAVSQVNNISENEQNDFFTSLTDFLDFSESNPFGDPS